MSRRTWFVLLFVIALLAVAPHLPQWGPAAWAAVRDADYAAMARDLRAGVDGAIEYTRARPQLLVGAAAGALVGVVVIALVRWRRARRARTVASALEELAELEREAAAPVRIAAPVAPRVVAAPVIAPMAAPPRKGAGRGATVRRLSAAGHSTAEISRVTRVGQDAIRLVLQRQGAS